MSPPKNKKSSVQPLFFCLSSMTFDHDRFFFKSPHASFPSLFSHSSAGPLFH
jgi:hypothetical protein